MSSRFNDMRKGWRVVIGQRLHEDDPYGAMLATGDYVHLNLPSKFERERKCCAWCIEHGPTTQIGFTDPRKEEGELLFPTLFTDKVIKPGKLLAPIVPTNILAIGLNRLRDRRFIAVFSRIVVPSCPWRNSPTKARPISS